MKENLEEKMEKKFPLEHLAELAHRIGTKTAMKEKDQTSFDYGRFHEMLLGKSKEFFTMVDFKAMKYIYVSKSVEKVVGFNNRSLLANGIEFLFQQVHPDDKSKFIAIHKKLFKYLYNLTSEERLHTKFDFNLRIIKADQTCIHLQHEVTFTELSEEGDPFIDFCIYTEISALTAQNSPGLSVYKHENGFYRKISELHPLNLSLSLTNRQIEILELISNGLTSGQIAAKLELSFETIKNHRKKILQSTGAKNIAEAIKIAFAQ